MLRTIAALALSLSFAAAASAETKVVIDKTHMCCTSCEKGATKNKVEGAEITASKADKNIVIVARDEKTAQAAVNAVAKAGYHGQISGSKAKFANDSGAKPGKKQQSPKVTGFHNCCKSCANAFNKAVAKTDGATGEVGNKETEVTVSGSFDAVELVKQLNAAGYHVKVEAAK